MLTRKTYKTRTFHLFAYIILLSIPLLYAQPFSELQDSTLIIFTKSEQTLGNHTTFGLAIADVDLDGDNDICIANYSAGATRLWLNNGSGNFTAHSQNFDVQYAAHDVDLADLNGDLYLDIFLANHGGPSKVYLSNGDGSYSESTQNIGAAGDHPITIQLIDIDGDGDNDAYLYNISAPNRIWLNDGAGSFTMRNIDYGGDDSNRQVLADLNNDQYPDMFLCFRTQESQLWLNDGAGNFINTGQNLGQSNDDIDFGDVDGDGDVDIVGANYSNISVLLNQNNTGIFTAGLTLNEGAWSCKLFDVELDGDSDLVTTHIEAGNKLWLNDGTGNFVFYDTIFEPTSTFSIVGCKDLDRDNDIDIVLAEESGPSEHSIYFNDSIIVGTDNNYNNKLNGFKLYNNYPNPFNPSTIIRYSLPTQKFISLKVCDILGNEIATLVDVEKPAGNYEIEFDASSLSGGIYFYELKSANFAETKKMILLK